MVHVEVKQPLAASNVNLPQSAILGRHGFRDVAPLAMTVAAVVALSALAVGVAAQSQWREVQCGFDFYRGHHCWEKICHLEEVCHYGFWLTSCYFEKVCMHLY